VRVEENSDTLRKEGTWRVCLVKVIVVPGEMLLTTPEATSTVSFGLRHGEDERSPLHHCRTDTEVR